jgi:maltooligosyltrehalose trehalohydrolase
MASQFKLSLGANFLGDGRTSFRVWAPERHQVEVCLAGPRGNRFFPLQRDERGYFSGIHPVEVGEKYKYRLDGGDSFPDPCSRFQPVGPHGPSEVVDPFRFRWSDGEWPGVELRGQVTYELHLGAFTPEGTYAAVAAQLPYLKQLGVTLIELMPLNTFPGRFNWGYDGVGLFAPCAVYGTPEDLRRLVDESHRIGMGIILDVVYNHFGPEGNYLGQFSRSYFSDQYPKEWGDPPNFDGPGSGPVRDFFVQNACYWLAEFHFDGLRLDATHGLFDRSKTHIAAEIAQHARAAAAPRKTVLIAENEAQDETYVRPAELGGYALDGMWVDDFHHVAKVAVTGMAEAYLSDYFGTAEELLSCARRNAVYQGQWYSWKKKSRGSPLMDVDPQQIVFFLQNHDQVGNQLQGTRLHQLAGETRARALTAYFLLLPQSPLLFMGQEFFASTPFLYFTDHSDDLQRAVQKGREKFLSQFPSFRHAIEVEGFHPLAGEEAFRRSRLKLEERQTHAGALALHRELLRLRREDAVFSAQRRRSIDGETLSSEALVLRYFGDAATGDRLLFLNLGIELVLERCPHPLLAAIPGQGWRPLISSEEVRFGGLGARFATSEREWVIPGGCAFALASAGSGGSGQE